ncbi:DUF2288 domain-containing protein [Proteobacteria bacterium 005FR1]|nr:DUF2288 domain-containing protein [Proteobacteria bacterium 005FR1]
MSQKQAPPSQELAKDETFQKLMRETGKIEWKLLSSHLDSGGLVLVNNPLDLVKVAYSFAKDDKVAVAQWLESGQIQRVEQGQADVWDAAEPTFWAVVVAPWVLIQPVKGDA